MSNKIEIPPGTQFGRLFVQREDPIRRPQIAYICWCACGTTVSVLGQNLRRGMTQSCGCLQKERARRNVFHHGYSGTPEWLSWAGMRRRCTNPKDPSYPNYGGRGITVCPQWDDFMAFLRDMGPKPSPKHSLDRVNNDLGYSPENCRWATASEQTQNRRVSHWITWQGQTRVLHEWSTILGFPPGTLKNRLARGWSVERAFTTPSRHYHRS